MLRPWLASSCRLSTDFLGSRERDAPRCVLIIAYYMITSPLYCHETCAVYRSKAEHDSSIRIHRRKIICEISFHWSGRFVPLKICSRSSCCSDLRRNRRKKNRGRNEEDYYWFITLILARHCLVTFRYFLKGVTVGRSLFATSRTSLGLNLIGGRSIVSSLCVFWIFLTFDDLERKNVNRKLWTNLGLK